MKPSLLLWLGGLVTISASIDLKLKFTTSPVGWSGGVVVWWVGGWTLKVENKTISASIELKLKLS